MKTFPEMAIFRHDRRTTVRVRVVVAACLVASTWPAAPALAERHGDWSGLRLAWQNDPRAVSDGAIPVEPTPNPERRPTRREQRRNFRRGIQEPAPPAMRDRAAEPRPRAADGGHEEFGMPAPAPLIDPPAEAIPGIPVAAASSRNVVHRDQPYGSGGHPRRRFDLHIPDGCSGGQLPLVVWIHGPDWKSGSKADCPISWLAGEGYAVASVDYRPSDVAVFPAQLDDCRAALDDLVAEASTWGVDPERICVAGTAAGGHLAALVALQPAAAGPIRETSTERHAGGHAAALAIVGAPVSLTTLGPAHDRAGSPASRLVGGPLPELREAAQRASPLAHVSADDPPVLIVHGLADEAVPVGQAEVFEKTLTAAGVDCTLVVLDDVAAPSLAAGSPAAIALIEFLDRVIGPGIRRPQD
jgi:acetyl esterase/lipase